MRPAVKITEASLVLIASAAYVCYVFQLAGPPFWNAGLADWGDPVLHQLPARALAPQRAVARGSFVAADVLSGSQDPRLLARVDPVRAVLSADPTSSPSVSGLQPDTGSGDGDRHRLSVCDPAPFRRPVIRRIAAPDRALRELAERDQPSDRRVGAALLGVPDSTHTPGDARVGSHARQPFATRAGGGRRTSRHAALHAGLLHGPFRVRIRTRVPGRGLAARQRTSRSRTHRRVLENRVATFQGASRRGRAGLGVDLVQLDVRRCGD